MNPDIARLHIDSDVHEPELRTSELSQQSWNYSGYPRSRDITKEFNAASTGKAIFIASVR